MHFLCRSAAVGSVPVDVALRLLERIQSRKFELQKNNPNLLKHWPETR